VLTAKDRDDLTNALKIDPVNKFHMERVQSKASRILILNQNKYHKMTLFTMIMSLFTLEEVAYL
jgi:hypothetical protein